MNARPVTDAQLSRALRAHLPERAAPGLRERVIDAAETTAQLRSFPSFLGALSEADPVSRRRSLLIAAALLVALAFASAAAVGALRLLQRDPIDELSLEPPADVPAFVLSSYERLPQLPPLALTWHDSGSAKGRVYVHQSGAVRFDRFTSADATEPSSYTILSDHRISGVALVESEAVWVEPGHEAIGDDPRVFLRTILSPGEEPGCEMERDPSGVGNGTAATGWRYVGVEYVAGRPTHHVACVGELSLDIDLWLDIETRLILRTREPLTDDAGRPIAGQFGTTEVTEITFGEQPAALFEPPEGATRISAEAYGAYLCTRDLPDEEVVRLGARSECPTPPEAEATTLPTPTPMPTVRPSLGSRPSGPPGPLAWTPESLTEDWPAPVRPEPAGGSSVLPMPLTHIDPTGDSGSDIDPWVDIRAVTGGTSSVHLKLASAQPSVVGPTEEWIAYGVVTDDDRDGVPDWRYGIHNMPVDATGERRNRAWRTNLHTGRTDDQGFRDGIRSGSPYGADADFKFGGTMDVAGKGHVAWGIELDMPFYTWASVIVNGRVVATDYAPDTGWLVATPGAEPGGTYLLEDPFPLRLSMTVAEGWTVDPGLGPNVGGLTRDSGDTRLLIVIVDNLAEDDCDTPARTLDPPLGPSVDDLVTFLEDLPLIDFSANTDVTLDGYRGKYLEYRKIGRDESCGWGGPGGWPTNGGSGLGDVDQSSQVWVLDVDGVRLVIHASSQGASETVKTEFRRIVESIQIEP
jgi:hypothetical protein